MASYTSCSLHLASQSVRTDTRSLCNRSDCPPLRSGAGTIRYGGARALHLWDMAGHGGAQKGHQLLKHVTRQGVC